MKIKTLAFLLQNFKLQLKMKRVTLIFFLSAICWFTYSQGIKKAPEIKEGEGPFTQLIIRGVMLIDGTGAPPVGPVDIVVKQNRIVNIVSIGLPTPGMSSDDNRPHLEAGGKELNCDGMYLMPGFIDMHGHIGGGQAPIAEYVFKLWMAHGITTIRDPGSGNGVDWVLDQKNKSAQNLITAPRIKSYVTFGTGS
jgi:adenine deaminase